MQSRLRGEGPQSGPDATEITRSPSEREVSLATTFGDEEFGLSYTSNERFDGSPDFALPALLLPAMKLGAPLTLPGGVSRRLLASSGQVQDVFNMWESIFGKIEVRPGEPSPRAATAPPASGVGCVFGGGVDSFHTLMRHNEEITHLLYLHLDTDDPQVRERAERRVREVARLTGKALIEVDTNLRQVYREWRISWKFGHGPWIASAALLLQNLLGKVYVPGSTTSNYDNLRPQGTHPILDPLWSTERLAFHHDGCEVRRVVKAEEISSWDVAMEWLQVCNHGQGGGNCGRCPKCLRTMVNLQAAGTLERCRTLPHEIDLDAVRSLDLSEYSESYFARENLRALESSGRNEALAAALRAALDRGAAIIAHSGYKEERLEHRLKKHLRDIERLQGRIERLHERNRSLRERNGSLQERARKLRERNQRLSSAFSGRERLRYALADWLVERVRRLPGSARALKLAVRLLQKGEKRSP